VVGAVVRAELRRKRNTLREVRRIFRRAYMLVDSFDGFRGDPPRRDRVPFEGLAAFHAGRDTAQGKDPTNAPDGVGAAAKTEEEDPIARLPQADDRRIAVDDIGGDSEAGCLADEIV
jgi:hypothetical protein